MTNIEIYDVDMSRMEGIVDRYDITVAEVIEIMLDNIDTDEEELVFG